MTRLTLSQAIEIRTLQLNGRYIAPLLLREAIEVIKREKTPALWPRPGKRVEKTGDAA